jgi:hypothetical protein
VGRSWCRFADGTESRRRCGPRRVQMVPKDIPDCARQGRVGRPNAALARTALGHSARRALLSLPNSVLLARRPRSRFPLTPLPLSPIPTKVSPACVAPTRTCAPNYATRNIICCNNYTCLQRATCGAPTHSRTHWHADIHAIAQMQRSDTLERVPTHARKLARTHARAHTRTRTRTHTCTHTHTHTHTCMCVCARALMHACTHTCRHARTLTVTVPHAYTHRSTRTSSRSHCSLRSSRPVVPFPLGILSASAIPTYARSGPTCDRTDAVRLPIHSAVRLTLSTEA